MEFNKKLFIKGFNHGYILSKFESQLLSAFFKGIQNSNSNTSGLIYGQRKFELELITIEFNNLSITRQKSKKIDERDND